MDKDAHIPSPHVGERIRLVKTKGSYPELTLIFGAKNEKDTLIPIDVWIHDKRPYMFCNGKRARKKQASG